MKAQVPQARTLHRGLALLELVASGSSSVTELAAAAGLDKGTTSRLLASLREAGYVWQDPTDHRYRLTSKVLRLASGYSDQLDLRRIAHRYLVALREEVEETVHLAVLEDDHVVYTDKVESRRSLRMASTLGHIEPAATTALGRAMLSCLPDDEVLARLNCLSASLPESSGAGGDDLVRVLRDARRLGYAVDDEDNQEHVTCVGAAIVDALGRPIAAISCSGPSHRMRPRITEIGELVRQTTASIGRLLDGSAPVEEVPREVSTTTCSPALSYLGSPAPAGTPVATSAVPGNRTNGPTRAGTRGARPSADGRARAAKPSQETPTSKRI